MTDSAIILQWLVFAGVLSAMAARGQLTLFHPTSIYLAFHAIVFCIRPTLVHLYGFDLVWNYIGFHPTQEHLHRTLLLSSLGLVAFCLGFALVCPYGGISGTRFRLPQLRPQDKLTFLMTAAVFAPLGLISVFTSQMEGEMIDGVYVMTGTTGYLNDLQGVLIPLVVLSIVVMRWRWYSFLPLLVYVYYRATLGWGRWTIVLTLLAVVFLYAWERRQNLPSWKFLVVAPLIFILFANLGLNRMYLQNLISGQPSEHHADLLDADRTFDEKFDTLDFANFDYLTYIVATVPKETGTYTYGTQYLQIFTEPIPRKLWPSKPIGPPVSFFNLNDYGNFIGLTPSLVGDGWMSGGWLGALLTMMGGGAILALFYNWFARNQHDLFKVYLFLLGNSLIVQLYRDGGISIFKFLLFIFLPVIVWAFLSHWLYPRSEETPAPRAVRQRQLS